MDSRLLGAADTRRRSPAGFTHEQLRVHTTHRVESVVTVAVRTRWTTPGGQVWLSPSGTTITMHVPASPAAQPSCSVANGS